MATFNRESLAAFSALEDLIMGYTKSFAVKAIVDLGIPDVLAKAGGQLTLKELAEQLSGTAVSVDYLGRIMTYAALNGLFTQASNSGDGSIVDEQKMFGLTPLSKLLLETESEDPRKSMAHACRFLVEPATFKAYSELSGAVRSGTIPFTLGNGVDSWEYWKDNPEWGKLANKAMAAGSAGIIAALVQVYNGFEGIKQLVDVGGGVGAALTVITQAHKQIQGVNFDLPHVIALAPEIPGVKHVGGDMFKSVPEGDAIFMKWVMHDWDDDECIQILQNCLKSIPAVGKVIIVDKVLPDPKEGTAYEYMHDMRMLAGNSGRERTAAEWRRMLSRAGFLRVEVFSDLGVVEGYKS